MGLQSSRARERRLRHAGYLGNVWPRAEGNKKENTRPDIKNTSVTNEQFDALIGKLEEQARRKPSAYKLKVHLLALLGNVYVGSILLVLLALLAALFVWLVKFNAGFWGMKGIVIVGGFLCLVLWSLWVRIEPPDGIEISAGQAPELFATINELRSRLGAPRFDHVLITDESTLLSCNCHALAYSAGLVTIC